MTRTLYLIGPSNVGKSRTAERLAQTGLVEFIDLDERLRELLPGKPLIGLAQNWSLIEPLLRSFETLNGDVPALVAIGAGTQDRDREKADRKLEQWLLSRRNRVIWIQGDQSELFDLNQNQSRDNFDLLEFGPRRQKIYDTAGRAVSFVGVSYEDRVPLLLQVVEDATKTADPNS